MNLRQMLFEALRPEDTLENVLCFYQAPREYGLDEKITTISCAGTDLPTREFDNGYGGSEGEPFVGYSTNYVYISCVYDGAEWIGAVPRNPENVNRNAHIARYGGE